MTLLRGAFGKTVHACGDFNQTFLALALFATGSRNFYTQRLCIIEQRSSGGNVGLLKVKMQFHSRVKDSFKK